LVLLHFVLPEGFETSEIYFLERSGKKFERAGQRVLDKIEFVERRFYLELASNPSVIKNEQNTW